jgi:uronate dehydrogenase
MSLGHIVMTGGSGQVGRALRGAMAAEVDRLTVLDLVAAPDLRANERMLTCDLADLDGLTRAFAGADGIVHLAGYANDRAFAEILRVNALGTWNVYEAARRAGVPRVVLASSNHAMGFYPRSRTVDSAMPMRPDGTYGLTKAFGELIAAMFWDKAGIRSLMIRIGNAQERPTSRRSLVLWISPRDLAQLVRIGLTHPQIDCQAVYGVSAAEPSWYDNALAAALGYRPQDRIADFATPEAAFDPPGPLPEVSEHFQGGAFCARDSDGIRRRRHDDR